MKGGAGKTSSALPATRFDEPLAARETRRKFPALDLTRGAFSLR
jgi:hypothetical protein